MSIDARYPGLRGRVAIITGGGQGLGRRYATRFAEQGAIAVIAEIDIERGQATAEAIIAAGGQAMAVRTDVSDEASVQAMAEAVLAAHGRIDILVNNAALFQNVTLAPFWELPVAEWRRCMDINLTGAFLCARAVVPAMQRGRWGRIVNLSSSTVVSGRANYLHYVSSKGAMVAFSRAMAREVGAWNITVNTLMPTVTKTDVERVSANDALYERVTKEQAVPRQAEMDDQAGLLLFLCSEDAAMITGQTHLVDGGRAFL